MKKAITVLSVIFVLSFTFFGCEAIREELPGSGYEEEAEQTPEPQTQVQDGSSCDGLPVNPTLEAGPFRMKDVCAPLYDGAVKYVGAYMTFRIAVPEEIQDPTVEMTVNGKTPAVGEKDMIYLTGFGLLARETLVQFTFCQAGEITLNLTLKETGQSVTYHITVKEDYDCNPGKSELTPEEFAYCVREVAKANGITLMNTATKTYGNAALGDYELTWEYAKSFAEGNSRQWWSEGYRQLYFTYRGEEPAGYMFRAYLSD